MSSDEDDYFQQGPPGLSGTSPGLGGVPMPKGTTASQAIGNESAGSSLQFNADVGRRTRASHRRDTTRIEDYSVQNSHTGQNPIFNFHIAQSYTQSGLTTSYSPGVSTWADGQQSQSLLPEQHVTIPERRKLNFGVGGETPPGSLPTSVNTGATSPAHLTTQSQTLAMGYAINAIQQQIDAITQHYDGLHKKLTRFYRIGGLESMCKDLNAQMVMFDVTIEDGKLISCVEETLKKSPSSSPLQDNTLVKDIKDRLDHIKRFLDIVDDQSYKLASTHDQILSLPYRQKREAGRSNSRQNLSRNPTGNRPVGVTKKQQKSSATRTNPDRPPKWVLRNAINILHGQIEEFQKQCQKLEPPDPYEQDDLSQDPIPKDLERASFAAIMLCKALCEACPNTKHQVHSILVGLDTQELDREPESGDTAVKFNLAFESPGGGPETWFVVKSTLKIQDDDQEMDMDEGSDSRSSSEPVLRPIAEHPISSARPSFSSQRKGSYTVTEPTTRFCLNYHKQATDDLAVALKHSDICEHRLFYPDESHRYLIQDRTRAMSLRKLLEERHATRQLQAFEKVRLARLLAEAVLKFHSADWLSCKWDWDNILIYEIQNELEPHLRFELKSPQFADKQPWGFSHPHHMGDVISQLGDLLGYIAVGPNRAGANVCEYIEERFSMTYADIIQACMKLSKDGDDLSDEDMQERFYTKVVSRLNEMEDVLTEWQ